MTERNLEGKVAVVTGAGRGVGLGIALELAARGAAVAINDVSAERAEQAVRAVTDAGGKAVSAAGDITDEGAVKEIFARADRLGAVDILINNAGIPPQGMGLSSFVEEATESWKRFVDINVYGVAFMTRAALAPMIEKGWGRVVTIVSDSARVGDPNLAMYAASKAAAATIMRSVAGEVGRYGVTCNSISLSTIAAPGMPEEVAAKLASRYAVKRLGSPADVAAAVAYFCSPAAEWVTGQTLSVDGGYVRI
ncbi:SDR family oxidoreductase [Nocardioides sp. dk4132]|uniref:SDR family NAD(P)-dependent oxidoreductase n=1 Tax=unclassified Nocardioides TaxID=2615069 RepID=UPI001294A8F5|nr:MULTISPECIES: SDR family oxidoreductase [unclassified Nocardioides]MQW77594.1 SDR family oxidoreductase [Nocardioides sp. dk4132]QGA06121.1 SDR family oxidoreductase [Nocardioides sp. dk884]